MSQELRTSSSIVDKRCCYVQQLTCLRSPMRLRAFMQVCLLGYSYADLTRALSSVVGKQYNILYVQNAIVQLHGVGYTPARALANLLKLKSTDALLEIYYPPGFRLPNGTVIPGERGKGDYWIGCYGNKIRDYGGKTSENLMVDETMLTNDVFSDTNVCCNINDAVKKVENDNRLNNLTDTVMKIDESINRNEDELLDKIISNETDEFSSVNRTSLATETKKMELF